MPREQSASNLLGVLPSYLQGQCFEMVLHCKDQNSQFEGTNFGQTHIYQRYEIEDQIMFYTFGFFEDYPLTYVLYTSLFIFLG